MYDANDYRQILSERQVSDAAKIKLLQEAEAALASAIAIGDSPKTIRTLTAWRDGLKA